MEDRDRPTIDPDPEEQTDGNIYYKMPHCPHPACYVCKKSGANIRALQCKNLHVSVYGLACLSS
jgi:hypothetical protein